MARKVSLGSFHHVRKDEQPHNFQLSSYISVTLFDRSAKDAVNRMIGILGPGQEFKVTRYDRNTAMSDALKEVAA